MHLKVLVPFKILVDEPVTKVSAEAENGAFALLPNHVDFVAVIVPGLLLFERENGKEGVLAVDEGILVKQGDQVQVSTRRAVQGQDLATLQQTIAEEFERLDDREKQARSALARLEAGFMRGTYELGGRHETPS